MTTHARKTNELIITSGCLHVCVLKVRENYSSRKLPSSRGVACGNFQNREYLHQATFRIYLPKSSAKLQTILQPLQLALIRVSWQFASRKLHSPRAIYHVDSFSSTFSSTFLRPPLPLCFEKWVLLSVNSPFSGCYEKFSSRDKRAFLSQNIISPLFEHRDCTLRYLFPDLNFPTQVCEAPAVCSRKSVGLRCSYKSKLKSGESGVFFLKGRRVSGASSRRTIPRAEQIQFPRCRPTLF